MEGVKEGDRPIPHLEEGGATQDAEGLTSSDLDHHPGALASESTSNSSDR